MGTTGATGATGPTGTSTGTVYATPASGSVGNQNDPLGNGSTIAGTSVLYFVADQAAVNLPAATTAGQQLFLIDATFDTALGFTVVGAETDTINDYVHFISGLTFDGGQCINSLTLNYNTMHLISDGNHHWNLVAAAADANTSQECGAVIVRPEARRSQ